MNVGDYVRTKKGEIGKIIGYVDEPTDYYFNCYVTTLKTNFTDTYITEYDNNIKTSPEIINLIEVGDYVNNTQVVGKNGNKIIINLLLPFELEEKDIKSIVTKEQFSQMEYKVGE